MSDCLASQGRVRRLGGKGWNFWVGRGVFQVGCFTEDTFAGSGLLDAVYGYAVIFYVNN